MTKKEIIKKIEELFYEKSFKEVSMQDIANAINMKKASLYYHFPSKEELILEVLESSFLKYEEFIKDLIIRWNNENFTELLEEFLNFSNKEKNIFSVINQNWYKENDDILTNLKQKQKIIFKSIHDAMEKKGFSKEKTFLFLTLINNIWKKDDVYDFCELDKKNILKEIENVFF